MDMHSLKPVHTAAVDDAAPPQYFDPATVVSRDAQGNPVSRYGDPSWDYSSQSTDGTSAATLHFFRAGPTADPRLGAVIREQHKALIWQHIDGGKMRAPKTVMLANRAAGRWAELACARGLQLFELLSQPEWVAEESVSLNQAYLGQTPALIQTLWRHRRALCPELHLPLQELKRVIAAEAAKRPENRQTPLIPSRVYTAILGGLLTRLDQIEAELDGLLDAYRQSMAASREAAGTKQQRQTFRAGALATVSERMQALGYDPASNEALDRFIAGRINLHQSSLMHTVAAFSGMRVGEVRILPLHDVLEPFEDRGSTHWMINGYTHKLERGVKRPTSWITSREGRRAVLLAERIARAILDEVGGAPAAGQQALLFPSSANPYRAKAQQAITDYQARLVEIICPVVEQHDIDELDSLELERGWQREGIEVGRRWPLAFHQLRRSLSVYAHRSGMVSLPSLKAQLQHITDEMRAYYADGYSRAKNVVFDKDHFSHEWNSAKAESSYFGYVLGLLFAEDEPLGQGARRMGQVVETRSREETLQLFKDGKLAYRETALGGCVATDECKERPLGPIPLHCLEKDCENLVVQPKRLDYVIRTQQTVVATLERNEPGSVEHRMEANDLQVLLRARQRLAQV
jgi:hypothetical protein